MAETTDFLGLTLPANGEMSDRWDQAVNGNFEAIDDNAQEVSESLVGAGGDLGNLKGTTASLQARIDVGINQDGTVKLNTSDDYTALQHSRVYGKDVDSDPVRKVVNRLAFVEEEMVELRQGESMHRDMSASVFGASALSGVARGLGAHQIDTGKAIQSPIRGFTPNSIANGMAPFTWDQAPAFLLKPVAGKFKIFADSSNIAIFNIDGFLFKVIEDLVCDVPVLTPSQTYYVFASRKDSDYNASGSLQWYYSEYLGTSLGGSYAIDVRIVPTHASLRANEGSRVDPTDGSVTADSDSLTSAGANFSGFGVVAGDILIVTSPASLKGKYVIESAATTDLVIKGTFKATSTSVSFHVEKPYFPSIGYNQLGHVDGRIRIGEFATNVGGTLDSAFGYSINGIYDTGWQSHTTFGGGFPIVKNHYLGTTPSQVEVYVKAGSSTTEFEVNPGIMKTVVTDVIAHVPTKVDHRFPALMVKASSTAISISRTLPLKGSTIYTTYSGTDIDIGGGTEAYFRIIARR